MRFLSPRPRNASCGKRAAKYTLPYFEVVRAKMILHAAEGMANDEIARAWIRAAKWSVCGASASSRTPGRSWKNFPVRAAPGLFPQKLVVQVKALACELPSQQHDLPLSRWSMRRLRPSCRRLGPGRQHQW